MRNDLMKAALLKDAEVRKASKARAWKALQAHVASLRKQEVCKHMRRDVPLWKGSALNKIKCAMDGEQNKVWDSGVIGCRGGALRHEVAVR